MMIKTIDMKQASQISTLGLGALALITLFYCFSQWHTDWTLTRATPTVTIGTSSSAALIAALPSHHLFGQSIGGDDLPVTSLQLRVTGIIKVEGDSSDSQASISISGQPSKLYQTGDELPDGVKIYQITPDAVILENDGQLEKLPLPRAPLEFKPPMSEEDL